jgi:hypothetical protein
VTFVNRHGRKAKDDDKGTGNGKKKGHGKKK